MVRDDVVFNTIQLISSSPNQQVIYVDKTLRLKSSVVKDCVASMCVLDPH
jgi:hypothetical protein